MQHIFGRVEYLLPQKLHYGRGLIGWQFSCAVIAQHRRIVAVACKGCKVCADIKIVRVKRYAAARSLQRRAPAVHVRIKPKQAHVRHRAANFKPVRNSLYAKQLRGLLRQRVQVWCVRRRKRGSIHKGGVWPVCRAVQYKRDAFHVLPPFMHFNCIFMLLYHLSVKNNR